MWSLSRGGKGAIAARRDAVFDVGVGVLVDAPTTFRRPGDRPREALRERLRAAGRPALRRPDGRRLPGATLRGAGDVAALATARFDARVLFEDAVLVVGRRFAEADEAPARLVVVRDAAERFGAALREGFAFLVRFTVFEDVRVAAFDAARAFFAAFAAGLRVGALADAAAVLPRADFAFFRGIRMSITCPFLYLCAT
jgi:hypothetical protein